MPALIPTKKFVKDLEGFRSNKPVKKKIAKILSQIENNIQTPGLNLERIINDPSAWSVRVDRKYRISFDPTDYLPAGSPNWDAPVKLLRFLNHDDLYKTPR